MTDIGRQGEADLPTLRAEDFNAIGDARFPGFVGMEITEVGEGAVEAVLTVQPHHLAPNGFLHGGAVVTLADTACGYGCVRSLPAGAKGFTTAELKTNFLATTTTGLVRCLARMTHGGRTTQVWDATVTDEQGRTLALFRCTQVILWQRQSAAPRPPAEQP